MSGLVNKVKEMVSGHHDSTNSADTASSTHHSHHGHGTSATSTNAGPHSSNVGNVVDPRVDSDLSSTGTHGRHETTAGPHSSNLANKADPRVDSDLDGSRIGTSTGHSSGMTGGLGSSNTSTGYGSSTTAGSHNSNLLNKADPRVDSDLDGSRNMGAAGTGLSSGASGLAGTHGHHHSHQSESGGNEFSMGSSGLSSGSTGTGTHGTHGSHGVHRTHGTHHTHETFIGNPAIPGGTGHHTTLTGHALDPHEHHGRASATSSTTTSGPHSSNLLNKMDPRVDSDRDGSRNMGATGTGLTGTGSGLTGSGTGLTGSHNTGSGLTGSHGTGSGLTGTGSGLTGSHITTAGPHDSNLMNKADPRVDSDLDGSRNMGATGAGMMGTGSGLTGSHNTGSGLTGSHSTGSGFTGTSSGMPGGYDGTSATHGTSSTGLGNSGVGLTGPVHDSAMLNKLDPRVKDTTGTGSATGGNSTYQTCLVSNSPKTVNNRDAAHVPPSQHADYGNVQNQTSDHHKRHGSGPTGDLKKDIIAHGCGTK